MSAQQWQASPMHSQFTLTLNFPFVCSIILYSVFTKNSFSSRLSTWLQTFLLAKPNAYLTFCPATRWSQLHFSTVNYSKTSIHYSKIRLHSHFILLTCTLHHYYHECCRCKAIFQHCCTLEVIQVCCYFNTLPASKQGIIYWRSQQSAQ